LEIGGVMGGLGKGIAIVGVWVGSALAVHFGGSAEIFGGATVATIFIAIFF